jgi:O-antigen/teichoic acid export membrane protein
MAETNDKPKFVGHMLKGHPSIGFRLVRASGLVAFGNICSRLLALLAAVVSARLLTEIEYGAFGVVQSALNMFVIGASLTLGLGATRYVALYRASDENRARGVVIVVLSTGAISSILAALLMIGAAPWLAKAWLHDFSLTSPLRWAALQLCLVAGYSLVVGILYGTERFGLSSATSIVQNIVILLSSFLLIPRFKTIGAIGAQAFGFATALTLGLWCIRDFLRGLDWRGVVNSFREEGRVLARFCLPIVMGGLFIYPFSWMSLAVITRKENGFVEVAFFTAADRYRLIVLFVAGFIATALLPIQSKAQAKGGPDVGTGPRSLELALIGSSVLLVPLSAALAFGGPQIMSAFGRSYQVNWSVLLPVIAWAGAQAHFSTIGTALLAHGRTWLVFAEQMVYGISVLILTYVFRQLGSTGLGLAHLITTFGLVAASVPILTRLKALTTRAAIVTIASAAAICLLCFLAWLCPGEWRLALAVPIAGTALAISTFVFTTARERSSLRNVLGRSGWSFGAENQLTRIAVEK